MGEIFSIIKLEDLSFSYPGSDTKVLDHLNLEINKGDKIGMMAPNGSGKTTLLHTIMGLCKPDAGTIKVFGNLVQHEKDFLAVRSKIGLLFQDSDDQLFCPTVLDDVAFGPLNLGFSRQEAIDLSRKTLEKLGILSFEQSVTHRLSGGQKRLVALAAVLAMEPEVLLLDEPTAGLDNKVKEKLIHILNTLDISYFVISHEFDFVSAVTDRVYSMENGRILTDEEIHIHRHEHVHKHGKHPHIHK
ncbi:MAG: energy-coupling factor ABC transporter ATP-binding protein [Proteobacteria bacterium]|nr:energy-coupling factor ABC transporter ATP-binding protein [Pseudomonadota bacterium]MBU1585892.1 energy-coupling factor ABC transporter ATP-binding protein [Pseudomonadota bacterium]MBU2453725.1 energy-coupling factor ABC transporter ATP-binding protein [Pseudomonadota bacterium]